MSGKATESQWVEIAKEAYRAYGEKTGGKDYNGNPLLAFENLSSDNIREAWVEAAKRAVEAHAEKDFSLDAREKSQIAHAHNYADYFASAGVPGHGQFMLISKLARKLGL